MLFKIADEICAEVPSALCNILSTQEHAPGIAASYVPVFATKVETLEEYWEYVDRIFFVGGKDSTANLILDDGGGPWFYFAFTYFVKLGLHDGGQRISLCCLQGMVLANNPPADNRAGSRNTFSFV